MLSSVLDKVLIKNNLINRFMEKMIYKKYTAEELINILSKYDKNTPIEIEAGYDSFMRAGGYVFTIEENKKRKNSRQVESITLYAPEYGKTFNPNYD